MLSALLRSITQCFTSPSSTYQPLPKKDDDPWIEEANYWKDKWKPDPEMCSKSDAEVKAYVKGIVDDLKKFPITSANKDIVKNHLKSIAECSHNLRNELIKPLAKCQGDEKLIEEIQCYVITTACYRP